MAKRSLTKTFPIHHESKVDGELYQGQFTTKKLSIGDTIKQGVIKTRLCEGLAYNHATQKGLPIIPDSYAEMVAHCQVALISTPNWFDSLEKVLDLVDLELIQVVYKEVLEHEESFSPFRTGRDSGGTREGDSRGEGSDQQSESAGSVQSPEGSNAVHREVVGPKVPFITEVG